MGAAASREQAKLPFGYTHVRKDHSCSTSSVSRRRLANRILKTSDTVSVTPFPAVQDTVSSLASIASIPDQNGSMHPAQSEQGFLSSLSSPSSPLSYASPSSNYPTPTTDSTFNRNNSGNGNSSSTINNISNNNNSDNNNNINNNINSHGHVRQETKSTTMAGTFSGVTMTGTGAGTFGTTALTPDSDSGHETLMETSSSSSSCCSTSMARSSNGQGKLKGQGSDHASVSTVGSGSSLSRSTSNHAGMTNLDMAHANAHSSNHTNHCSTAMSQSSLPLLASPSSLSIHRPKQLGQSRVQTSDMDIISALGIADRPYESSTATTTTTTTTATTAFSFIGANHNSSSSSASPLAGSRAGRESHRHQTSVHSLPRPDLFTIISSPRMVTQGDMDETTGVHQRNSHVFGSSNNNNTIQQQQQQQQEKQQQQQSNRKSRLLSYEKHGHEDDFDDADLMECAGGEGNGCEDVQSIMDEDLGRLSPIPFSELPSLTNIGLCSHGIVKLSSNIRFLSSATCVQ
ncbi:hypothetical protein BGZ94_003019, partial [Podila epigama]